MIKSIISLSFLIGLNLNLSAQSDTCWTKSYGGSGSEAPGFGSGYFGAPEVKSTVDSNNNIWITCASTSNDGDVGSNFGSNDIWVIKLNPDGDTLLTKVIGGSQNDIPYDIQLSPSEGVLIAGLSSSSDVDFNTNAGLEDGILLSLDSQGNIEWIQNYGGSQGDMFFAIEPYSNGYYLVGSTGSVDGDINDNSNLGSIEAWIAKVDFNGNLIWNRTTSGATQNLDYSEVFWDATVINSDQDIVAQGITGDFSDFNTDDILMVRYDSVGNKIWQNEFGSNGRDIANGVEHSVITNEIIGTSMVTSATGDVNSYNGGQGDFWVYSVDLDGNLTNQISLGGTDIDYPYSISTSPTNTLFLSGITQSTDGIMNTTSYGGWDFWAAEINPNDLDTLQTIRLGGSLNDYLHAVNFRNDGKIIAVGRSRSADQFVQSNQGASDLFVACLTNEPSVVVDLSSYTEPEEIRFFPNPFSQEISIKSSTDLNGSIFTIRDATGRVVYSTTVSNNQSKFRMPEDFRAGVYHVILISQNSVVQAKIIKN